MKASEVMTKPPIRHCREETPVREAAKMMADNDVGSVAVCDSRDRLVGMVTDRDICCRVVAKGGACDTPVRQIMSTNVQSVLPDAEVRRVESLMQSKKIRRVPVVDGGRHVQGFISLSDIAHHCKGMKQEHELMQVLGKICSP